MLSSVVSFSVYRLVYVRGGEAADDGVVCLRCELARELKHATPASVPRHEGPHIHKGLISVFVYSAIQKFD